MNMLSFRRLKKHYYNNNLFSVNYRAFAMFVVILCGLLFVFDSFSCSSSKKDKEPREMVKTEREPTNLPIYLQGTIRYEAELLGYAPTLVQGYGLVVGLDGTGSNDTPVSVRGIIEAEAGKMQRDSSISSNDDMNIQQLLDSLDTAVVLVEATIPPGSPRGSTFDVRVAALPSTNTTSLVGGRLWTTRLSEGLMDPTGPQSQVIAKAHGDIFINPFAQRKRATRSFYTNAASSDNSDNGDSSDAASATKVVVDNKDLSSGQINNNIDDSRHVDVERRIGRILEGGVTIEDVGLILQLRYPSHSRSRAITNSINTRFRREHNQSRDTASPIPKQADERIIITVPPSWSEKTDEFVEILMHTQVYPSNIEMRANRLAQWLQNNPIDAPSITWCWVALGTAALPTIQEMYFYNESIPRLAALKAGALLGDPLVVGHLAEIASDKESALRVDAINLIGKAGRNIRASTLLRNLLNDVSSEIRLAALDALMELNDPLVMRVPMGRFTEFELYSVPSNYPMIYVTQQKKQRIVVFGRDLEIKRPSLASTWDERFIVIGEKPTEISDDNNNTDDSEAKAPVRLYYREERSLREFILKPSPNLVEFIKVLGGDKTVYEETTGLGLSYGEAIGALYAMQDQGAIDAPLVLEQDRLLNAILSSTRREIPVDRPETSRPESRPDTINNADNTEDNN